MEAHFLNSSDISVPVETRGEIRESVCLTKALGGLQLSLIVLKWASAKLRDGFENLHLFRKVGKENVTQKDFFIYFSNIFDTPIFRCCWWYLAVNRLSGTQVFIT